MESGIRVWWTGAAAAAYARVRALFRSGGSPPWRRRAIVALACVVLVGAVLVGVAALFTASVLYHVHFNRENLPDPGPFTRFEFATIGHVYDTNGQPLIQLAREHRLLSRYEDIPPIVREAILAAEDKRFFSHNGLDYGSVPRVLVRIRLRTLLARLFRNPLDEADSPAIFPQGGSTITQQLVRGHFLKGLTAGENSRSLRGIGRLTRSVSYVLGARNANMIARKVEEMRLAIWVEQEMTRRFGSKRRAKEELLARYASHVYMGKGQYGFATAAQYYFGRPLATFTAADADKAALLAGIPKSPRDYAPSAVDGANVLRRRNQTLTLMARHGALTSDGLADALERPIHLAARQGTIATEAPAVVAHVLQELSALDVARGLDDLLVGRIQVYSTVDARVQHVVNDALEHGLLVYERRHPRAKGLIQGSVVVLGNGDGRILAETGGRLFYNGRAASYSDFNRVTGSLRQPGSAIKPIVYLAAFRKGPFDLDTLVPDEPIEVPDGEGTKWIANYDGRFKGRIPLRQALAESRNAVAIWITGQIGIDTVLRTSERLGVQTPLHRYVTTALGASEMNLLELANAYRVMASGLLAQPYVIRKVITGSGTVVVDREDRLRPVPATDEALLLIQEGLRGVVRLPTGTAHALAGAGFPIAVMGKTGTTNEFRDALFVGSTYGPGGITVAVRIGFDDNRSLGTRETGSRVALPIFREVMLRVYRDQLAGSAPSFPRAMEARITGYLQAPPSAVPGAELAGPAPGGRPGSYASYRNAGPSIIGSGLRTPASPAESERVLQRGPNAVP